MPRIIRATVMAVSLTLCAAIPAAATPFSTDFTDLWWNSAESGWGVNFVQQQEVVFATLFVYGADNSPRWYVASALTPAAAPEGATTFTGALFQTTGPHFGAPTFDPGQVTPVQVGSMAVTFTSASAGVLTYEVAGTAVTKAITRQTWRAHSMAGEYVGGLAALATACTSGSDRAFIASDRLSVTHDGATVTMSIRNPLFEDSGTGCDFTGTYRQQGRLGSVSGGRFDCTIRGVPSNSGVFALTEIDVGANGFTARFEGSDQFCNYDRGSFGGVREIR